MKNYKKLHKVLKDAGIPIHGVSENEDGSYAISFKKDATDEQKAQAESIKDSFDPDSIPDELTVKEKLAALEVRVAALEKK